MIAIDEVRDTADVPDSGRPLPAGWRWAQLGEVCDFLDSRRAPINETERKRRIAGKDTSKLFPYYGANGQVGWIDDYLFDEPLILLAEDGGAFGSTSNPIAYSVRGRFWVNNHAHVLKPKEMVDFDYCACALRIRPDVGTLVSGSTRAKLNQETAARIPIPLPPFAIQKRIAAMLTEQMAAVERARAAAEAQLAAAQSLPAAYLRAVFGSDEAQRWPRKRLGEACDIVAYQVDPKVPEYGILPHVSGENIESGLCRLRYLNSAAADGMTSGKYLFEAGDLLYSKLRPYLRKAVVVDFCGLCSADIYPIRVNRSLLDPHFAAWMLVSDEFTDYADDQSQRSRMPKLNREQLFAWNAPVPSCKDQRYLAIMLDKRVAEAVRLCKAVEAQLEAINRMPVALLRQALSGAL